MFCSNCGESIPDNSKFCLKCGAKLETEEVSGGDKGTEQNDKNKKKKKKWIPFLIGGIAAVIAAAVFAALMITHVICFHDWNEADCTLPKTCTICERTEGEALGHDFSEATCTEDSVCSRCNEIGAEASGHHWTEVSCTEDSVCSTCGEEGEKASGHDWQEATCTEPETCAGCGETKGEAAGHKWKDATCDKAKTCSVCKETSGKALGHDWAEATTSAPKTCRTCGKTTGEKLKTYEAYFSAGDIIDASGVEPSYFGVYEVRNLHCTNGNAYASTTPNAEAYNISTLSGVHVSNATAGTVTISGTVVSKLLGFIEPDAPPTIMDKDISYFELSVTVG